MIMHLNSKEDIDKILFFEESSWPRLKSELKAKIEWPAQLLSIGISPRSYRPYAFVRLGSDDKRRGRKPKEEQSEVDDSGESKSEITETDQ